MFDKRLLALVPEAKKYIFLTVFFQWIALAANIVLMVSIGFFLQGMLFGAATQETLFELLVLGAVVIAVRLFSQTMAQRMSLAASTIAKRTIRQSVYEKLVRLGPSYSEHIPTSQAVQISTEGVEQLEVYFGSYLPQLFYAVLAPITLFACLAPFSLLVAGVLLVCTPLIPMSIMAAQRIAKRVTRDYFGHYSDLGAMFLENIQGLTTLKIFQADEAFHKEMNKSAETFRQATMRLLRMQLNSITIMDLLAYGGAAVGIVITLYLFSAGDISFAGAFTIAFLSAEFFIPLRSLGSLFHTAMNGIAASEVMFNVLEVEEPGQGTERIDRNDCAVKAKGVRYSYDKSRWALKGIDFETPQCGLVGIVGESGSGKSTFAAILAGHLRDYKGEVFIGSHNVSNVARDSIAANLTTVSFSSWLFKGSIRDNLLMGNSRANEDELWDALRACRLDLFVQEQGGLDAPVAEGCSNLSGGQRQRLCLARALLHDSPVYIFDEATSNIDAESEQAIVEVMKSLAKDHVVIAIAHRLETVRDAQCIYVMDHGRILESGTHEDLRAQQGVYERMWARQQELESYVVSGAEEVSVQVSADGASNKVSDGDKASESLKAHSVLTQAASSSGNTQNESFDKSKKSANVPSGTAPVKQRSSLSIMMRLVKLVKPLLPFMVLAIVLGVLGFVCAIFLTVFGAAGLLVISGNETIVGFNEAVALVVVCGVLRGFLHYGEQICNHYIAFKLLALIRDKVFSALRRLAPAKLEGRDKGNLVSLVTSDIELLEVFYAHTISPVFIAILMSLIMVVFMAFQSWQLALIALLAYVVIGVVVPFIASRGAQESGRALRDQLGEANSFVLESLRGLREILQYGRGARRSEELLERTDLLAAQEKILKGRTGLSSSVVGALVLLFDLVMIACGYALYSAGAIEFSNVVICAMALMSSFGPVIAVAALGTTLQQTIACGARVLDLLDEAPQCSDITDGVNVSFKGASVDRVSFAYGKETILENVSVNFEPGRVVSISGKSGSGKSTLLKLLMRFWDPTQGSVCISDTDLRNVNTPCLRNLEGYMTQETHIFEGTLRDNIMLAKPDASYEEVVDACEKASLTDFIEHLPKGLDTPVGELGDALSGGERQRVGLARVFLHNAPFVLLDEPTSNLDSLTEASVLKALSDFREGKTIVLVSHRASTCAFADIVYSVERGRMS